MPNLGHTASQFPSLRSNATRVEQSRLPSKPGPKSRLQYQASNLGSSNIQQRASHPAMSKIKPQMPEISAAYIPQWQLQIICGPGHDHNNFDSQQPGTRFKLFEHIGEQIWRPSSSILDEEVQSATISTSLDWPDFLRFRVLQNTTPWEQWLSLYSKEHYGRKPLLRDCYLTHGWNKQSKSPIWLPQEVRNAGTLRSILAQWFSSSRDKVTIVFEYINKDLARSDAVVSERFSDLNLALSDHELLETISSDSPSPLPTLQSSSSYQLHSSPPPANIVTSNTQILSIDPIVVPPGSSSSDSEFPTIEQLIATTGTLTAEIGLTLPTITLRPSLTESSSSPLSTIPDSPEIPQPLVISPPTTMNTITNIPLRSTSKVSYVYPILVSCDLRLGHILLLVSSSSPHLFLQV